MRYTKLLVMLAVVIVAGCAPLEPPPQPVEIVPSAPAAAPTETPAIASEVEAVGSPVFVPSIFYNYDRDYTNPFGVIQYNGVTNQQGLGHMRAAGSRWATNILYWRFIEPQAPISGTHTYDWSTFDGAAQNAQAAGVQLFVLFSANPDWAAQYPGGPVTNTVHLTDFVTAVAERYDGDGLDDAPGHPVVTHWSFYGEPDNKVPWRSTGQGKGIWGEFPSDYADMLALVAPAMRSANPNSKIYVGGIAYDWFTDDPNPGPFVRNFLAGVLQRLNTEHGGPAQVLDGVAFHYYPIRLQEWPTLRHKALEVRGILDANGASTVPLVLPEMGYPSGPAPLYSETTQAQHLVQMYVQGLSMGIQHLSWYTVFDVGDETMGLFNNGDLNQPRPAYYAYATMTAQLTSYHYVQALGVPGVEGYVFRAPNGTSKTVLWASGASPVNVPFMQTCVRRVSLLGILTQITDGSVFDLDSVNGRVTLTAGVNDPMYVGPC